MTKLQKKNRAINMFWMFFSVIKDIYSACPVVVGFKAGKGYGVMWDVDAVGNMYADGGGNTKKRLWI